MRFTPPLQLIGLARRQEGLVSAAQCADYLVDCDRRARLVATGEWIRVVHGVFDLFPRWRTERARDFDYGRRRGVWLGLLACGPGATAVGASALVLHRAAGLPASITPEVSLGRGQSRRSRGGIVVRQYAAQLPRHRMGDYFVVRPEWALAQAVPHLPRRNAVAVLDSLLHQRVIDAAGLAKSRELARGRRGMASANACWDLVDHRAESPLETFARLDCVAGGVRPDELQVSVFDEYGRFVARGDLGWRLRDGRWLIAEIDGAEFHDSPDAVFKDRKRQNTLLSLGHAMLRFSARDVVDQGVVAREVALALSRLRREVPKGTGPRMS